MANIRPQAKMNSAKINPSVFNLFKPAGITSYDVIRTLKKNLPREYKKLGHFGTLDPFASGVLMVGAVGATKINNYVHEFLPKTYLGIGKLGIHTATGDNTSTITKKDESEFLSGEISRFSESFIESTLREKFIGKYLQRPHVYSATKYEGKALHVWAREGVEIKKECVEREIYKIEVVRFSHPYLSIRFTVSSGTYIRTLFSDCANFLGTYGTLVGLLRESVGHVGYRDSIMPFQWRQKINLSKAGEYSIEMDKILPFSSILIGGELEKRYRNGIPFSNHEKYQLVKEKNGLENNKYYWIKDSQYNAIGLAALRNGVFRSLFNLPN